MFNRVGAPQVKRFFRTIQEYFICKTSETSCSAWLIGSMSFNADSWLSTLLASTSSGMLARIICHPIDTCKVRQEKSRTKFGLILSIGENASPFKLWCIRRTHKCDQNDREGWGNHWTISGNRGRIVRRNTRNVPVSIRIRGLQLLIWSNCLYLNTSLL